MDEEEDEDGDEDGDEDMDNPEDGADENEILDDEGDTRIGEGMRDEALDEPDSD